VGLAGVERTGLGLGLDVGLVGERTGLGLTAWDWPWGRIKIKY
jgi:hypothetical protein